MAKSRNNNVTVWITGDQCSLTNTALVAAQEQKPIVLMIESIARGGKLIYHKKKLVLIYSVMRHFALELESAGYEVDYYFEHPDFETALKEHFRRYEPQKFFLMQQSEFGATEKLLKLLPGVESEVTPHCNFVSTAEDFEGLHSSSESRVTMDRFYRMMRKKTGLLMEGSEPIGGAWNFDKENRQPPGKEFRFAEQPSFPADKITTSVIKMVDKHFSDHPGTTENWNYAVTRKDAVRAATDFFEHRLDQFGPHQDAMLAEEAFLNHSVLSPYINVCLLQPLELCRGAEHKYHAKQARLSSVEGFIRQLIGWREFVWRVYWRLMPEYKKRNALGAALPLPEFFSTGKTQMRCLSDVLKTVHDHGYAHHIARLMILGNFGLIAGVEPLELNEWFSAMFVDGYDWVMVPNVIGMTLHADNGYVGTKPYAASANYINKMSNYCRKCHFNPKTQVESDSCPFNALYWDFLLRNQKVFSENHRMSMIMQSLATKSGEWKHSIRSRADKLRASSFEEPV